MVTEGSRLAEIEFRVIDRLQVAQVLRGCASDHGDVLSAAAQAQTAKRVRVLMQRQCAEWRSNHCLKSTI